MSVISCVARLSAPTGVFPAVIDLLRQASGDDEILNECLYVLTNPWDPLVGADVPTSQALVASGILEELHGLLDPAAPGDRLSLLLKGLGVSARAQWAGGVDNSR